MPSKDFYVWYSDLLMKLLQSSVEVLLAALMTVLPLLPPLRSSSPSTAWARTSPPRRGSKVFLWWSRSTRTVTTTAATSRCTGRTRRSRSSATRWEIRRALEIGQKIDIQWARKETTRKKMCMCYIHERVFCVFLWWNNIFKVCYRILIDSPTVVWIFWKEDMIYICIYKCTSHVSKRKKNPVLFLNSLFLFLFFNFPVFIWMRRAF